MHSLLRIAFKQRLLIYGICLVVSFILGTRWADQFNFYPKLPSESNVILKDIRHALLEIEGNLLELSLLLKLSELSESDPANLERLEERQMELRELGELMDKMHAPKLPDDPQGDMREELKILSNRLCRLGEHFTQAEPKPHASRHAYPQTK